MTGSAQPASPNRPPGRERATAVIELRGVSKRYGTGSGQPVTAADDVSLTAGPGGLMTIRQVGRLG